MSAPKHNRFAAKEDGEKLSSCVWVYLTRAEKAALVKAAAGEKLAAWSRRTLKQAAGISSRNAKDHGTPKK